MDRITQIVNRLQERAAVLMNQIKTLEDAMQPVLKQFPPDSPEAKAAAEETSLAAKQRAERQGTTPVPLVEQLEVLDGMLVDCRLAVDSLLGRSHI